MVGFSRKGVTMTGSLQTKSGKYYAVINTTDTNGKRKQKWISTGIETAGNNKRKAEKRLREILQEYEKNTPVFSTDILFSDYLREWIETAKLKLAENTYISYLDSLNTHIIPYFDILQKTLCELTRVDIQNYVNSKFESGRVDGNGGLSAKTVKSHIAIIKPALRDAVKNGYISFNPSDYITLPKSQKYEPSFYTDEQLRKLFSLASNEPIFPIIYFASIFGLRRSEVLGLKWDSIDFDRNILTVKHTVVSSSSKILEKDTTKNKSSYRSYPLSDNIIQMLFSLKAKEAKNKSLFGKDYNENDYIFKLENGVPYNPDYITKKFPKILKKYGLPHIRFHDLRHSCASLMVANGYTLKDIQEWLGHADIQTTANTYAHLDVKRKNNIMASMTDLLMC